MNEHEVEKFTRLGCSLIYAKTASEIAKYGNLQVADNLQAACMRIEELEAPLKEIVDGYCLGHYPDSIRHAAKVIGYPLPWEKK